MGVIKSILDTDLYKFTTSYAYMKCFPEAEGVFVFDDRDNTEYTEEFLENFKMQLQKLGDIRMSDEEYKWVNSHIRFIPEVYWEWLRGFHFNPDNINAWLDEQHHLHIETKMDKLYKVTLFETPVLAIVSELRNKMLGYKTTRKEILERLMPKIELSNQEKLLFAEFGMRRRFSWTTQDIVVEALKHNAKYCTGTSNVYFAMKYDMKPIGTHPHEWFMFHGAQFGYKHANYLGLENWVNTYDGDLGIALSDTYTSKVFLQNFSKKHAKLFDGVRQDSGDPYLFTTNVISRYKELGIDPTTKTIVFSNALTFPEYAKINEFCKNRIRCSAGIGTNLTNDTGNKPSNIVMKLRKCRMNKNQQTYNCIKISDDMGKHMGSAEEFMVASKELGLN